MHFKQLKDPSKLRLHLTAWINWGIFLPFDGELDGDISTICYRNEHVSLFAAERQRYADTEALAAKITIKRHPGRLHRRKATPRDVQLRWLEGAAAAETGDDPINTAELFLETDLENLNRRQMEQWRTDFARDITNAENPLPNGEYLLDKVDIWALTDLYRHHQGEDGVKWLFTELLGIPYRSAETGAVALQPAAEPLLNFANLPQPPRQSKEKDLLMNRILADKNAVEQEHVPIAPRVCSYWEEQHEQLRVQKMQTLNGHLSAQQQQEEAPFVYARTAIKDRRSLTIEMVSRRN